MATQKIVVDPLQTIQEPQNMASKAGEVAKTGPSSLLLVDLKVDQVVMLGDEEDKDSSQIYVQEHGKDNAPREVVQDLGHSEEDNERVNEAIIGLNN